MKMGIDARMFGAKQGGGSIGRYVAELVMHLQEVDKDTEYVIFLRKENFHECVIKRKNFSKRIFDVPQFSLKEQREFPKEIRLSQVQAMHYPSEYVPIWSSVPFVTTIHDLNNLEGKYTGLQQVAYRHMSEHAVHASRHIVAISQEVKRSILENFRVSGGKISVVYPGVSIGEGGERVRLEDLGVRKPYVLALGSMHPQKNHDILLSALQEEGDREEYQVVFAGKFDDFAKILEQKAKKMNLEKRVRFIHAPTNEEVTALIKNAAMLAHPAKKESFGALPLEAALAKRPVAVADTSVFHEIFGDTVQYVPQNDARAWAAVMHHAVHNEEAWKGIISSAYRHAKRYNWDECAREMKEIYVKHAFPRM